MWASLEVLFLFKKSCFTLTCERDLGVCAMLYINTTR